MVLRADKTVLLIRTRGQVDLCRRSVKTSSSPGRSMTEEYPSALPPPSPPRPFQLRDKGLLRYRPPPTAKGSSSRSANKTPWPCFTRDIKRVARLFPLGSLLCKRRKRALRVHRNPPSSRCDLETDEIIRLRKQMGRKRGKDSD